MIDLEAAAGILREIGRHHTALGRLYSAGADLITRDPPVLPSYGFAAHVDAREPVTCEVCGEKPATREVTYRHQGESWKVAKCETCDAQIGDDPDDGGPPPVAEMATHAPGDDDTEPPDSHPFAAPIPPAPPAVEPCGSCDGAGCPACREDTSYDEHERRAGRGATSDEVPEQTTLDDAVRERTGCIACADVATSGRTGQAHTCEPIPFGDDAAPPLPVDDTVAGRVSARIAAGTTGRSRKPAKDWEPSDTSWARTASIPLRVTCAEAVAAYIASCGPRHVKPGDRDFVRWVRDSRKVAT